MRVDQGRLRLKSQRKQLDMPLVISTAALILIGLIIIYDASVVAAYRDFNDKFHFFANQLIWAMVGTFSLIFFTFFDYKKIIKIAPYIFLASFILLLLVLVPFIGTEVLGARRWINIGTFTFQPSEFAKLAVVFYATYIISKFENFKMRLKDTLIVYFLPIFFVMLSVVIQPDLGTALIFFGVAAIIYFTAGAPIIHFLLTAPFLVLAVIGAIITHPYRIERIKAFLDPRILIPY